MGKLNVTYKDFSNESSTVGLEFADVTDGAGYTALLAAVTPALVQLNALSAGAQVRRTIVADSTDLNTALPSSPYAQREIKWYIPLVSVAGGRKGFTIPVAQLEDGSGNSLLVPGSDLADMNNAIWQTFANWLNTDNVFFPGYTLDGTPYLVGRNI